jgi:hypothetical protein
VDIVCYEAKWGLNSIADRGSELRPDHFIFLDISGPPQPPRAIGKSVTHVRLNARWMPMSGWGAHVEYWFPNRGGRFPSFQMKFSHDAKGNFEYPGYWALILGDGWYQAGKQIDQVSYRVQVRVDGAESWMRRTSDEYIVRYLASEESFRDQGLAELDELETCARTQIPSGKAFFNPHSMKNVRSDRPPVDMGPFRTSQLTQEQMAAFLHDAVSEIRRWKQMLRENYRDMYAAVVKAFPLRECLELEKEGEKRGKASAE